MQCPYCKSEMERGTIRCSAGGFRNVKWRSDSNSKNEFTLIKGLKSENLITPAIRDVFSCMACKIIIKKIDG